MSDIFKCYFTYVAIIYAPIEAFFYINFEFCESAKNTGITVKL